MRFLRTLLYGLILVVVGLISALTAMRFAIHGREVSVPKLTGLTAAEAQRIAAESGLAISRDQRFYSSDVPEGRIVSQLPPAGTRVRTGFRIRIAESLGPQKVEIPNLLGQSVRSAELNLKERGLELGSVARSSHGQRRRRPGDRPEPHARRAANLDSFGKPVDQRGPGRGSVRHAGLCRRKALRGQRGYPRGRAGGGNDRHRAARAAGRELRFGRNLRAGTKPDPPLLLPRRKGLRQRASSDATIIHQTPAAGQRVFPGNTVQFEVEAAAE